LVSAVLGGAGRGGAGEGWESKHNNGPVTIQGDRILLQVVCPQRKSGLQGSSFDKQRDCLTVNAMAYYRHLFSLYIHCSSQRCVKQRRVAFRGMGKAERPPVVRVHRSEKVEWSEWQQSQFFIRIALHQWFSPHKAPSINPILRQMTGASSFMRFLDHTRRRTTVGRTPLDEWFARRRDLYLKTQNTHNRQTSMPLAGFEPTFLTGERPQT